jgi:integrase
MNAVQPIKKKRDIDKMKKALHGRDLLLFTLGINTGLRISDLLQIKISDVLTAKGTAKTSLSLTEKKTGKTKTINFNKNVVTALKHVEYSADGYLFPSQKGKKPISRIQAYRVLNAAADRCGLEEVGTHTLRKTFGYHAYKKGFPIERLMILFNHSTPKHTLRYIGIVQEDLEEVYNAINL